MRILRIQLDAGSLPNFDFRPRLCGGSISTDVFVVHVQQQSRKEGRATFAHPIRCWRFGLVPSLGFRSQLCGEVVLTDVFVPHGQQQSRKEGRAPRVSGRSCALEWY